MKKAKQKPTTAKAESSQRPPSKKPTLQESRALRDLLREEKLDLGDGAASGSAAQRKRIGTKPKEKCPSSERRLPRGFRASGLFSEPGSEDDFDGAAPVNRSPVIGSTQRGELCFGAAHKYYEHLEGHSSARRAWLDGRKQAATNALLTKVRDKRLAKYIYKSGSIAEWCIWYCTADPADDFFGDLSEKELTSSDDLGIVDSLSKNNLNEATVEEEMAWQEELVMERLKLGSGINSTSRNVFATPRYQQIYYIMMHS